MKLIFLDFDGVIVTRHTLFKYGYPPCIERLNRIVAKTGAEIIISSTWRYFGFTACEHYLLSWGFTGPLRGMTGEFRASRGEEIQAFLDEYKDIGVAVDKFVILDDDSDVGNLDRYLVKTDTEIGLTDEHVNKAIELLCQTSI